MKLRKFLTILVIIMAGILPILSSIPALSTSISKLENLSEKKWTVMAYSSADSDDASDGILSVFSHEVSSSDNIDVVILEKKKNESTKLWYVENNHSLRLVKDFDEVSMGNYTTLRDFINYCKDNFTSERYILFFCGHGAGWRGACRDHSAGYRDDLTMGEMKKALIETGGVDIICFSGPCIMGAIESVYELRDCADVYIGSEAFSAYNYWRGTFSDLLILLNEKHDITNREVGKFIIESIKEKTPNNEYISRFEKGIVTYSAINTSGIKDLADALDSLIDNLTSNMFFWRFITRLLRHFSRSFFTNLNFTNLKGLRQTVDVYDFAKKCSYSFFNNAIRMEAKKVMDAFDDVVIANFRGSFQVNSYGLSIYFPISKDLYDKNYAYLDFANDTIWNEFLESYLQC
jgi:hypothetical protein